jgi:cytochrome c biogenesis protein CcdA
VKTCVVCGKKIITGKKYCHNHRVPEDTSSRILYEAKKAYKGRIKLILGVTYLIAMFVFLYSTYLSATHKSNEIISILGFIAIVIILLVLLLNFLKIKIHEVIYNLNEKLKTKDYENFIRNFSKKYKEKKEFESSLTK